MLDAIWGSDDRVDTNNGRPEPSTEMASHMTLELDEDGEPELARFTYVDESTCIGCKNCALVARNTFFMEESLAGKARVFNQGGDNDDLIDEAIDSCPVNCIHFVSHEDLVTLEQERVAREGSLDFNNYANFKRAWTGQEAAVPETQATYYGSLASGNRCNNCPSRGCAQCPMFGVGENPMYRQREAQRLLKKRRSGAGRREAADRQAQRKIDILYGAAGRAPDAAVTETEVERAMDAIFGEGYSFGADYDLDDEGVGVAGGVAGGVAAGAQSPAEIEAQARLREELSDESVAETLDPYAVLGVSKDAELTDIKRAFRRLAMRWHPDRNAQLPELERLQAELIFKQINLANEVLTDSAKRTRYDAGESSLSELVSGFWDRLTQRMQGGRARRETTKGVVAPVAPGSGVALAELAAEEEQETGMPVGPLLLGAVTPTAMGGGEGAELEPAVPERKPGVKYDYWGRPMA